MKRMILIGILLLSITAAHAQEDDEQPSVTIQPLEEALPEIGTRGEATAVLSPDGEKIVWADNQGDVCYALVTEGSPTCFPYGSRMVGLAWSPDSRYAAFSEDAFIYLQEADLWLIDTEVGELRNLTDDQFIGNVIEAEDDTPLDYLPVWHPITGELYFWRAVRAEGGVTMDLYKTTVEGGEPEHIRNLTPRFPVWSVYVNNNRDIFGSPATISPDGTQMAVLVRGQRIDDSLNGVWLLELEGSAAPEQIMGLVSMESAYAPFMSSRRVSPIGLAWTSDGAGLVIAVTTVDFGSNALYYWDKESDTLTPFYDFSSVESQEALMSMPQGIAYAPAFYMPAGMVLLADDTLLSLNQDDEGLALLRWMLPPDGEPQILLLPEANNGLTRKIVWVAASTGGSKVLITGNMLTLGD